MKINYFKCEYSDYSAYWDGEDETRVYGCMHMFGDGFCDVDNKWGGEEAECRILDIKLWREDP